MRRNFDTVFSISMTRVFVLGVSVQVTTDRGHMERRWFQVYIGFLAWELSVLFAWDRVMGVRS